MLEARTLLSGGEWITYGHDPQHTGLASVPSQALDLIRWQTSVDLTGASGSSHYGSPLITPANTVIVPVRTTFAGGFRLEGRSGIDGSLKWTQPTDYRFPPYAWTPPYGSTLTPANRLYFPGAGGTVYYMDTPDAVGAAVTGQLAFYGIANYSHSLDSTVFINTPITSDGAGNIFFGFQVTGATGALNLQSGIARISASGAGTWVAASTAAADAGIRKVAHSSAPALSNDARTLYVAVSNGSGTSHLSPTGYLLALDSTSLQTTAKVALNDPRGAAAFLSDLATSSPTVGPDGDVYFGVLDNPFDRHDRGWMLHFSGDLRQTKIPGGFGWDITASIVPAAMVPSYHGSSSYLLMSKYNDYKGFPGSQGINKLAILDPNDTMPDPITGTPMMKEILTIAGVTPDPVLPAVREWCINAAAVDPFTKSVLANSEDGKLYRWDLTSNTFSQTIDLGWGVGEPYTPTVIGPGGIAYTINNSFLFAVQAPAGPVVLSHSPVSGIGSLASVRVTFSKAIDVSTFTPAKIASFIGPGGPITVTGVNPVAGSGNKQFDIAFPSQTRLGNYTMVIGPDIRDTAGHAMDQDDNGAPGETPGDQYILRFTVQGPKITASTPSTNILAPVGSLQVTFNEPMDPNTFTPDKVFSFRGPNGPIDVTDVTSVDGSNNTKFNISFEPQATTGRYLMLIGPDIRDLAGHRMDQDGNFVDGETPGDLYLAQFGIVGPHITLSTPFDTVAPVDHIRVNFNEPMDPDTFSPDQIEHFTTPAGDVPVTAVSEVDGSNGTQFDIWFAPQTAMGRYAMVIGPDIRDLFGNAMDQDSNLIPGEIPGDQYTARFTIEGPRVIASIPLRGFPNFPVDSVRVTFNEPIAVDTFTPDQVVSFTGPRGAIPVTGVSAVEGSNDTQFDITFSAQATIGTYTMVIGPDIFDQFGNQMDQDGDLIPGDPSDQYTAKFSIAALPAALGPDGFGYQAAVDAYQEIELRDDPDAFVIIDSVEFGSFASVPVDLGSNRFNFYGATYTGDNQFFVGATGLISFGSANAASANTNLTSAPPQATIAVLWSYWYKPEDDPTGPMVLGKFDNFDDAGIPHRLIIEWNQVRASFASPKGITFQAILSLNTGSAPSDFVFNYADLNTGDSFAYGRFSTVGSKAAGSQGANRLLVSYFSSNSPFLGDRQAILWYKAPGSNGPAGNSLPGDAVPQLYAPQKWGRARVAVPLEQQAEIPPGALAAPSSLADARNGAALVAVTGDLMVGPAQSAAIWPRELRSPSQSAGTTAVGTAPAVPDPAGIDNFFVAATMGSGDFDPPGLADYGFAGNGDDSWDEVWPFPRRAS